MINELLGFGLLLIALLSYHWGKIWLLITENRLLKKENATLKFKLYGQKHEAEDKSKDNGRGQSTTATKT